MKNSKYHVGFNKHSLTRVTNFREKTMKETMKLNAQSSLILQYKIVGNTKDTMSSQHHDTIKETHTTNK
jgi:hypothetical protein